MTYTKFLLNNSQFFEQTQKSNRTEVEYEISPPQTFRNQIAKTTESSIDSILMRYNNF